LYIPALRYVRSEPVDWKQKNGDVGVVQVFLPQGTFYTSCQCYILQTVTNSLHSSYTTHIVRIMYLVSEYTVSGYSILLSQTVNFVFLGWCKIVSNIYYYYYYYLVPYTHYFRPKILHPSTVHVLYLMMLAMFPTTTYRQHYIPYMLFSKRS
jgi:hypothetical protein